jgi:hypothetical protein
MRTILAGHEIGSHARTHPCRRPDTAEYCSAAYTDDEVSGSRDDILRRTTQPYVWSWCYPCGHCANHDFIRKRIADAGYLVARSYPDEPTNGHLVPDLRTWAPDFYNAAYTQVVQKRGGSATTQVIDVEVLNKKFDEVYAEGGIYHFLSHPQWLDLGPAGFFERHLAHIARRSDVWYVPMGPLYAYLCVPYVGRPERDCRRPPLRGRARGLQPQHHARHQDLQRKYHARVPGPGWHHGDVVSSEAR